MSAKTDTPEQHNILHQYWSPPNCCLCNAEAKIAALEAEIEKLKRDKPPTFKYVNSKPPEEA